jgi:hypothetical protein
VKIELLRECAFKALYAQCSNPDLAGYVSDDFEVIAKALLHLPGHPFLRQLLGAYASDSIPGGGKLTRSRPTHEIMAELASRFYARRHRQINPPP